MLNPSSMRSIVLLSSGLDSTVNLFAAKREGEVLLALTFDYGQRAARKEIDRARRLADHCDVPHQVIELPWLGNLGSSALTKHGNSVPTDEVRIDDIKASQNTAK